MTREYTPRLRAAVGPVMRGTSVDVYSMEVEPILQNMGTDSALKPSSRKWKNGSRQS